MQLYVPFTALLHIVPQQTGETNSWTTPVGLNADKLSGLGLMGQEREMKLSPSEWLLPFIWLFEVQDKNCGGNISGSAGEEWRR